MKDFLCLERPFLDFVSQTPRPRVGVDPCLLKEDSGFNGWEREELNRVDSREVVGSCRVERFLSLHYNVLLRTCHNGKEGHAY